MKLLTTLTFPDCSKTAKSHTEGKRILSYKLNAERYAKDFYKCLNQNAVQFGKLNS